MCHNIRLTTDVFSVWIIKALATPVINARQICNGCRGQTVVRPLSDPRTLSIKTCPELGYYGTLLGCWYH